MNYQIFKSALFNYFPLLPIPTPLLSKGISEFLHEHVLEIKGAIEGKSWADINLLFGPQNALMSGFSFLLPIAKLYYLPGFILAFLSPATRQYNDCLLDVFIERIDPRRSGDEEFNNAILNMSRQQSALVTCFLMEIVRIEGNRVAMESLENYWDIFEKDIPNEYLT